MSTLFDKQAHPDRPWDGRGYGRIRLDEPLAKDLKGILWAEIQVRRSDLRVAREAGQDLTNQRLALKRINALMERVTNLIHDQGWEDAAL